MMSYKDSLAMLMDSVMAKYRQKNRLENFSLAVANLFVLGYTVTKEYIIKNCLVSDKYSQLLYDRENTYMTIYNTKNDRVHNLAIKHLAEIDRDIKTITEANKNNKLREYRRIRDNVNKLWNRYHDKRLFGIKKPIQYNNYKLSNYLRYYNNSFIAKYLNNSDTTIELQQKIKQIPNYLEEHKQLWLDYYNNHKNRFTALPNRHMINKDKIRIDSMNIADINLSLVSRGII